MSLGDYLRLQRAKHDGITPWDIEAAVPIAKGLYRQMEQRYRAVGDDETIQLLADFYGVPFDDLRWRLDWSRKALSRMLLAASLEQTPITLYLWNGDVATGQVAWWDLGAVGLDTGAKEIMVVQRHAVDRWEPRLEQEDGEADEDDEEDDEDE